MQILLYSWLYMNCKFIDAVNESKFHTTMSILLILHLFHGMFVIIK